MRLIGTLTDEAQARVFADFLHAQGLESDVRPEGEGAWSVWVLSDDHVEGAKSLLPGFLQNPEDPMYASARSRARAIRKEQEKQEARARGNLVDVRTAWHILSVSTLGRLTFGLILASAVVAAVTRLGGSLQTLGAFTITEIRFGAETIEWAAGLPEVRRGEVWRLVTPILLHFGLLHLIFNMLWLKDLGSMIERRQGALRFGAQVLAIAVISNLAQYETGGPFFGGMSGVVYGLLGYVWIVGRLSPQSGLFLHRDTVMLMMIWFGICLLGVMGGVANTAHAVGLGMGCVWGWLAAKGVPGFRLRPRL